ncbi:HAD family hydrolase [Muribacter muris]|uniref:HAD family hydrolase n=1 Tax=Muribacter muris TaxID=67855 RepID=UPI00069D0266|nr:HAD family hydrolase [Muribacter muris]
MKTLYIFDFDGTLADTLPLAFMCFRETFLKFNNELLSNAQIETLFGGSEQSIIHQQVKGDQQTKQQAIRFFYQLYQANHALYAHCPIHIRQLLARLKQQGKTLAIFTGKGRESLNYSLAAFELHSYFDFTVCDDDIAHSKPAPDGLLHILQKSDCDATQAIYFGDSPADVIAGERANIDTVQVNWITQPEQVLTYIK